MSNSRLYIINSKHIYQKLLDVMVKYIALLKIVLKLDFWKEKTIKLKKKSKHDLY